MTGEGKSVFKGKVTEILADGRVFGITVSHKNGETDIDTEPLNLPDSLIAYGSDVMCIAYNKPKNGFVASAISVKKDENSSWQRYGSR